TTKLCYTPYAFLSDFVIGRPYFLHHFRTALSDTLYSSPIFVYGNPCSNNSISLSFVVMFFAFSLFLQSIHIFASFLIFGFPHTGHIYFLSCGIAIYTSFSLKIGDPA